MYGMAPVVALLHSPRYLLVMGFVAIVTLVSWVTEFQPATALSNNWSQRNLGSSTSPASSGLASSGLAHSSDVSVIRLPKHEYAYAAFLAEPEEPSENDDDDKYFVATRMLIYQLLHDPATRTNNSIPFLVLVTEDIPDRKRQRLIADGATIVPVSKISFDWIQASRKRWRDVMAKLHLFNLTQYQRILFLDSDILVVKRMDGIFEDPAARVQHNRNKPENAPVDEGVQPATYVFAGVSGQGGYDHPYPGRKGRAANAGFILLQPSKDLFQYYLKVAAIPDRFDSKYPEQNLWIYLHRREGNMPWQQLDPTWNVNWATMNDYKHGVASLHTKWWSPGPEQALRDIALSMRWKMEGSGEARDALRSRKL